MKQDEQKKSLDKAIEKSKQDKNTEATIDWYLKNKKDMGFRNPNDMLNWYFK